MILSAWKSVVLKHQPQLQPAGIKLTVVRVTRCDKEPDSFETFFNVSDSL